MRTRLLALAAAASIACGASHTIRAETVPAGPATVERTPGPPVPLAIRQLPICTVSGTGDVGTFPLRIHGKVFGAVDREVAWAEAHLDVGDPRITVAGSSNALGFDFVGEVRPEDLLVSSTSPEAVEGEPWLVVRAIELRDVTPAPALVGVVRPPALISPSNEIPHHVSCERARLGPARTERRNTRVLAAGGHAPVFASRGGAAPIGALDVPKAGLHTARFVQAVGAEAEIVLEDRLTTARVWTASSLLMPDSEEWRALMAEAEALTVKPRDPGTEPLPRCAISLPIYVRDEQGVFVVGVFRPGAPPILSRRAPGTDSEIPVALGDEDVDLVPFVDAEELASCEARAKSAYTVVKKRGLVRAAEPIKPPAPSATRARE